MPPTPRRAALAVLLRSSCRSPPGAHGPGHAGRRAGSDRVPCQQALRRARRASSRAPCSCPAPGQLEVRLDGTEGDWDVALFDAAGQRARRRRVARRAGGRAAAGRSRAARPRAGLPALRRRGRVPATRRRTRRSRAATPRRRRPTRRSWSRDHARRARQGPAASPLGLDMTEHGGAETLGVVLHGADDEAAAAQGRLRLRVLVADLVAAGRRAAASAARRPRAAPRTPPERPHELPHAGRLRAELKTLAAKNPGLVKLFTLPHKTFEGRDVLGHRDHRERRPPTTASPPSSTWASTTRASGRRASSRWSGPTS